MISTISDILYVILHILITALAKKKSAIALRPEEIRKERLIATASDRGVVFICHMIYFLFYRKIKHFFLFSEIGFIMGLSWKLNNIEEIT